MSDVLTSDVNLLLSAWSVLPWGLEPDSEDQSLALRGELSILASLRLELGSGEILYFLRLMNLIQLTVKPPQTSSLVYTDTNQPLLRNPQPQSTYSYTWVPTYFIHGHASLLARVWVNSSLLAAVFFPSHLLFMTHPQTHMGHISIFTSNSGRFVQIRLDLDAQALIFLAPFCISESQPKPLAFFGEDQHACKTCLLQSLPMCFPYVARQEFCPSKNQKSPIGVGEGGAISEFFP